MQYLSFIGPIAAKGAAKFVVLVLPVALTSLKIGVHEWRRRSRTAKAAHRMARSLCKALGSGIFAFEAAPGKPFVNVFQREEDTSNMELILSPRAVVRAKPWWSENPVPVEAESRIVRVYMLGPASTPDPESVTARQPERAIFLPAPEEPPAASEPVPAPERKGRKLADFCSVSPAIAKPADAKATARELTQRSSGNMSRKVTPEIGQLEQSAMPTAGFRPESLRSCPPATWRPALPGFTMATVSMRPLPVLQSSPIRKDPPRGEFVALGFAMQSPGVVTGQREPFFFTPPAMLFPRTHFHGDKKLHGSTPEWKRGWGSSNGSVHGRFTGARLYRVAK
jgi:hypothetical protein